MHKKKNTMKIRKMKKGRKVKGGLKQRNPNLTSWQAVYKMIENPESTLTKIAYSSLKGFIFKLDVTPTPENSEFFGLNTSGTDFNVPIYSLIFKFAIISKIGDEELPEFSFPRELDSNGKQIYYSKDTENLNDFKIESKIQQSIYLKTINPSGKPICLAVADFSYFNRASAGTLLNQLRTKQGNSKEVLCMLDYLLKNVTGYNQLGMITMELANSDFKELNDLRSNAAVFKSDCNTAIAQILILFLKLKILNYDSHAGNVLGKEDGTKTFLIDFGRTLDFKKEDPFPSDKDAIVEKYDAIPESNYVMDSAEVLSFKVTDLYLSRGTTEDVVIDRMQKIIKFMAYIDYCTNTTYFDMGLMDRAQLVTFLRYLYGPQFSDNWTRRPPNFELTTNAKAAYASLIPTIRSLTQAPLGATNRLSEDAVEAKIQRGELFSIDDVSYDRSVVSSWSVPVPAPVLASSLTGRAGEFSPPLGIRQRPGRGSTEKMQIQGDEDEECDPVKQTCCNKVTKICRNVFGLGGRRTKKRRGKKQKN